MRFDQEQMSQLRDMVREVSREVATEVATEIVVREIKASEARIITTIITSVGQMIEDNILPQFQEIRDDLAATKVELKHDAAELKHDVAVLQRDMTEVKYDIGSLKRDVTGFRVARVQLAA